MVVAVRIPLQLIWLSRPLVGSAMKQTSGGEPPGCARTDVSVAPASSAMPTGVAVELSLVPHEGYIVLDQLPDESVFSHAISLEKVCLTPSGWGLELDEDGFGVIPPDGIAAEPILLEERLNFTVLQDTNGGFIIGNRSGTQHLRLADLMQKWENRVAILKIGVTKASKEFDAALFRWPRPPGCMFVWSAKSVYENLAFEQFGGQQWRWVDASWRRWRNWLEKAFGLGEHIQPTGQRKDT